ncbi:MAG TPA: hypothetical protein VGK20_09030 [Candidatus Binatia bacterium]
MTKDFLDSRRRSIEETFFKNRDEELVGKLKKVFHQRIDKEEIRTRTGITDEAVLDNLVALDLSGEMIAAFKLFPLVEVAWADGHIREADAFAVRSAAKEHGIEPGSAASELLENALRDGPRRDARKAWYMFAAELCKVLDPAELAEFREDLLASAKKVAATSGGILDMVLNVSANEQKVLHAIARSLTPSSR